MPAQPASADVPRRRWHGRGRLTPYLFLSPALLVLAAVVVYPLAFSVYLSLHNYVLSRPLDREFVGLGNFADVLGDPLFWASAARTAIWIVGVVVPQLVLGMLVAVFLNQAFRARAALRGIVLLPWVTPSAAVALTWVWMLHPDFGVINDLIRRVGFLGPPRGWLVSADTALPTVMVATIWQGVPFFAVMLLAAMQTIPADLLEAARVDGAGPVRCLRSITLPLLLPTILITTLLRTIWVANYVDMPYLMTGGGPGVASHTLAVQTFITVKGRLDFGHGAALALVLAALLSVVMAVYLWQLRQRGSAA